jgi:hypothetical protein
MDNIESVRTAQGRYVFFSQRDSGKPTPADTRSSGI